MAGEENSQGASPEYDGQEMELRMDVADALEAVYGHFDGVNGIEWYWDEEAHDMMPGSLYLNVTMDSGDAVTITNAHDLFNHGAHGFFDAVCKMVHEVKTIPTIAFRWTTLRQGMKLEVETGMQLTNKAPASTAIVKRDYGVKRGLSKVKTQIAFEALIMAVTDAINVRRFNWGED
tara:strand:+ start:1521 stop:2048 length:528 start_codon:yes stop_codon:yes gene_type:complete